MVRVSRILGPIASGDRGIRRHISEAERQEILDAFRAGESVGAVGRRFSRDEAMLRQLGRDAGVLPPASQIQKRSTVTLP
jgi:hypothetical protein